MTTPSYLAEPQIQYLEQLLNDIATGLLLVPRFQRGFVWTVEQQLKLFQSIQQGIPIGSILVWRTTIQTLESFPRLGPLSIPKPVSKDGVRSYILDGLQRLSTLCGAFYPRDLKDRQDKASKTWTIYYDLQEKLFHHGTETNVIPRTWLPLWKLLDSIQLLKFQRELKSPEDDRLIEAADALAKIFRQYKIPVLPIVTDDINEATFTFQRINSQGTTMSEVHMVNALSWRNGFELLTRLEDLEPKLEEFGWGGLDKKVILNTTKASLRIDFYKAEPEELSRALQEKPELLEQSVASLKKAAIFLKERCGVFSERLLPYSFQMVLLAEALRHNQEEKIPEPIEQRLHQWFWLTTYTSFFTGMTSGLLERMLTDLVALAKGGKHKWWGNQHLQIEPIRSFDFRGARAKALMLRLAEKKPRNLEGQSLEAQKLLSEQGPKALLQILPSNKIPKTTDFFSAAANSIIVEPTEANKLREVFLNQPETLSTEFLHSHLISEKAADALCRKDYGAFLQQRAKDIDDEENAFFEKIKTSYFQDLQPTPMTNPEGTSHLID
jgi:Protein of unknown function DUF262